MISFQPFRNTDPPVVTAIWRAQAGRPGYVQPASVDLFEQLVFGKLHFDYDGLILARDGDRPVGMAHAGFGPNQSRDGLSHDVGITSLVAPVPDCPAPDDVAAGLLEHCETYLAERGAKVFYGGGVRPLSPFYLGLYGGSEPPGVLETDHIARQAFADHGYREVDRTVALKLPLETFEAPFDRRQLQIRRQMVLEVQHDVPTRTWWDALMLGDFDLTRLEIAPRGSDHPVGRAVFRNIEPIGVGAIGRRIGLIDLFVDEALRRRGVAVYLLSEAFRQFGRQGVTMIETQTMQHNTPALALLRKLGFGPVFQGSVFRKKTEEEPTDK